MKTKVIVIGEGLNTFTVTKALIHLQNADLDVVINNLEIENKNERFLSL